MLLPGLQLGEAGGDGECCSCVAEIWCCSRTACQGLVAVGVEDCRFLLAALWHGDARGSLVKQVCAQAGGVAILCVPASLQADTGGRGVVALCGPTGRGALVMGTADGSISLLDSRRQGTA